MAEKKSAGQSEAVVLLHGIGRTRRSMARAERTLASLGYETFNLDYPSRSLAIPQLADHLCDQLRAQAVERFSALHFLTHSMGGIVTRAFLQRQKPSNLGHVVMLAPPNQGSEVADFLSGNFLYNWFYGPAGGDLKTSSAGFLSTLGRVDFPLGVIAGSQSIDPVSSLLLPKPNDGKVSVENTKVDGMADHLVLPVNHTFIMRDVEVLREAAFFLRHGKFQRTSH